MTNRRVMSAGPVVAVVALATACVVAAEPEPSTFDAKLKAALDDVARLCPPLSAYPEPVEAIPLPWEIEHKSTDELLKMLGNWNPAYVSAVSEGIDIDAPGAADVLVKSLKSPRANVRLAAMTSIGNSVANKIRNWHDSYPDLDYRAAQAKIRDKYAHLLSNLVAMLHDPSPVVRAAAPEFIRSFNGSGKIKQLAPEIVPSICDGDEDVAERATLAFSELLLDVPAKQRLALLNKALRENPKPRGRGNLARFIVQRLPENEQRQLVPVLLFHLRRVETRDMMFSQGYRELVVKKLAELGETDDIAPYMLKYIGYRSYKHVLPALEAAEIMGPKAAPLLGKIKAALARSEKLNSGKPEDLAKWRKEVQPTADRVLGKLRKMARAQAGKQEAK